MTSNFKKIYRCCSLGAALLAGLFITACSDEQVAEPGDPGEVTGKLPVYISLNVTTPVEGRSRADNSYTTDTGSSSGEVVPGNTPENEIRSATIYLVDETTSSPEIKLTLIAERGVPAPGTDGKTNIVAEIYDVNRSLVPLRGKTLTVYVVANTDEIGMNHSFGLNGNGQTSLTQVPKDAKFSTSSWAAPLGDFGDNGKLMPLVNADNNIKITIPDGNGDDAIRDAIYEKFSNVRDGKAYWEVNKDNGNKTLDLERAVARIEYRDLEGRETPTGPVTGRNNEDLPDNTYWVGNMDLKLQLYSLMPFNVNTESYLFRHTAPGTVKAAGNATALFGSENGGGTGYNWVASPWWKGTPSLINALTVTETDYNFTDEIEETPVVLIEERQNADEDGYHPLCYVSENTLYSIDIMAAQDADKQALLTKYATGVAFKMIVLDKNGEPLKYEPDPTKTEGGTRYPADVTNSVTLTKPEGKNWITITDPATAKWVDSKQETLIIDGEEVETFTLTYIACLIHNNPDRGANDPLPPMYYGVVRNNTYQVTVNSVAGLPLPQDPRSLFLEINCSIAKWNDRWDDGATLF